MDPITTKPRQDPLISAHSSNRAKNLENNEPTIETRPDSDQDDSQKLSTETVKLSNTSLKLSTSSPVKSSDRPVSIETKDQAQQALSRLISDFQSNPSQAHAAHSNVFAGAVKSLLG